MGEEIGEQSRFVIPQIAGNGTRRQSLTLMGPPIESGVLFHMKAFFGLAAAGAAFVALASPAAAQSAGGSIEHDMQCFLGASMLADGAEDAQTEQVAMWAAMYFVGKIYGARPDIDFDAAMESTALKLEDLDMQAIMMTCSQELLARGNAIERAGKALEAKGI